MRIIAFEGIDATGKETQSKLFYEYLISNNYKVAHYSFPRYETEIGLFIKSYLDSKTVLSDFTIQMLFLLDMYEFQQEIGVMEHYNFDYLILDRYVLSNKAYSISKGLNLDDFNDMYRSIRHADVNILLTVPLEETNKRREQKDKFEKDYTLLNNVRENYIKLSENPKNNMFTIDGLGTIQEIADTIKYLFDEGFLD